MESLTNQLACHGENLDLGGGGDCVFDAAGCQVLGFFGTARCGIFCNAGTGTYDDRIDLGSFFVFANVDFADAGIIGDQALDVANRVCGVAVNALGVEGSLRNFGVVGDPCGVLGSKGGAGVYGNLHLLAVTTAALEVGTAFVVVAYDSCNAVVPDKDCLAEACVVVVFEVVVGTVTDVGAVASSLAQDVVVVEVNLGVTHHGGAGIQILIEVVVDGDFVTEAIAVAIADQACLVMIVEVVPAEGCVVDVVLCVQKAVVTVLVAGVGVIEFAMVDPNVVAGLLFLVGPNGDGGVCGNGDAVGVVQDDFCAVTECNDLVFVGLANGHVAHGELDIANNDVVLILDH